MATFVFFFFLLRCISHKVDANHIKFSERSDTHSFHIKHAIGKVNAHLINYLWKMFRQQKWGYSQASTECFRDMVWCVSFDDDMTQFGMISFKWHHQKESKKKTFAVPFVHFDFLAFSSRTFYFVVCSDGNQWICVQFFHTWFNSNDLNQSSNFSFMPHCLEVRAQARECKIECKLTTPNSFEQSFKCYARFSMDFFPFCSSVYIERCKLRLCYVQWSLPNYSITKPNTKFIHIRYR